MCSEWLVFKARATALTALAEIPVKLSVEHCIANNTNFQQVKPAFLILCLPNMHKPTNKVSSDTLMISLQCPQWMISLQGHSQL